MSGELHGVGETSIAVARMGEQLKAAMKGLERIAEDIARQDKAAHATELARARFEERTAQKLVDLGRDIEQLGKSHLDHGGRISRLEARATTAPIEVVPDGNTPQTPPQSEEKRDLVRAKVEEVRARANESKARTKIWVVVGLVAAAIAGAAVDAIAHALRPSPEADHASDE